MVGQFEFDAACRFRLKGTTRTSNLGSSDHASSFDRDGQAHLLAIWFGRWRTREMESAYRRDLSGDGGWAPDSRALSR